MTDDKDFKRIIRARMADTGERYTTAKANLRPEAIWATPSLAGVIPMDLGALQAWRAERPRPVPGPAALATSYGPDWELTVDAGGPLGVLEPPALELARVAALGAALSGVGYVVFGLHLRLPAPAGSDPDNPRPPSPNRVGPRWNRCSKHRPSCTAGSGSIWDSTVLAPWPSGPAG